MKLFKANSFIVSVLLLINEVNTVLSSDVLKNSVNSRHQRANNERDLVIVFDSTGSMSDDLAQLRAAAIQVVNNFASQKPNPISNYILIVFNDPSPGFIQKTRDKNVFLHNLNEITVSGGGDCEEQCYAALELALQEARPNSFVSVFTDAYTHQEHKKENIKKLVSLKKIQLFFLVAGEGCKNKNYEHSQYSEIAISSSGGLLFESNRADIGAVSIE